MNAAPVVDVELERAAKCSSWNDPRAIANGVLLQGLEKSKPSWVKRAIADGADMNARMESGKTVGRFASYEERVHEMVWPLQRALLTEPKSRNEILTYVLRAGANPNKRIFKGSIFSVACTYGWIERVSLMLSESRVPVDLLIGEKEGSIASLELFRQIRKGGFDVRDCVRVMELMQSSFEQHALLKRPDLAAHHLWTHANKEGESALKIACQARDASPVLHWMLETQSARVMDFVRERDVSGTSLLLTAVEAGSVDSVKLLLAHGCRLDIDDHRGQPLMARAAKLSNDAIGVGNSNLPARHQEIMQILLTVHAVRKASSAIDDVMSLANTPVERAAP